MQIFFITKFICHCKDRRPVRCYRERSSGVKIVCIWKLPISAVTMDVHQKPTIKIFYNFYRNFPFHIAQKIPNPSNHEIISDLTVCLKGLHLLVPCEMESYQVLQLNLGHILCSCLTIFFFKFFISRLQFSSTRAETRFGVAPESKCPCLSAGVTIQSATGGHDMYISQQRTKLCFKT